jgi:hypothetical protein
VLITRSPVDHKNAYSGDDMSARLEQNGVYLLPDALNGSEYIILQATQEAGGWQLVECHATPHGNNRFRERAAFPPDQMIHYAVTPDGTLVEQNTSGQQRTTKFTLANLSLLGYIQDGAFVSAAEAG